MSFAVVTYGSNTSIIIFEFSVKSYVRNTINLSLAKSCPLVLFIQTGLAVLCPLLDCFSFHYRRICSRNVRKAMKIKKLKITKYVFGFKSHMKTPQK
jgi:hypothetical protein